MCYYLWTKKTIEFFSCPQRSSAWWLQHYYIHYTHNTRTIIISLFLPWINDIARDTSRLQFKTIVSRLDVKRTCIIYIIRVYIYIIHIYIIYISERIPSRNTLKRNINSNCCVDDDNDAVKNNYVDITRAIRNSNNNNNDDDNTAFTNSIVIRGVSPADVFGGHVLKILNVSRSRHHRDVDFASRSNADEWIIHTATTEFGFWF